MCQYLADEPEEIGVAVYAEFAMNKFYKKLYEHIENVQESGFKIPWNNTNNIATNGPFKFMCYEHLTNPLTREDQAKEMVQWFFPGGLPPIPANNFTVGAPYELSPLLLSKQNEYKGKHSTSRNKEIRQRLRQLVERFDSERYHGAIARANRFHDTLCNTTNGTA